jgi:hypothetical protein
VQSKVDSLSLSLSLCLSPFAGEGMEVISVFKATCTESRPYSARPLSHLEMARVEGAGSRGSGACSVHGRLSARRASSGLHRTRARGSGRAAAAVVPGSRISEAPSELPLSCTSHAEAVGGSALRGAPAPLPALKAAAAGPSRNDRSESRLTVLGGWQPQRGGVSHRLGEILDGAVISASPTLVTLAACALDLGKMVTLVTKLVHCFHRR